MGDKAVKQISFWLATAISLGSIIGAGIFVLSGTAIALAGVNAIWVFIAVGVLAMLIAMQSGELGAMFPQSMGSTYSYVYEAFGSELGFMTGAIRYFGGATSVSVVALGFGSYFIAMFGLGGGYAVPISILMILGVTVVNLRGIKNVARADGFLVSVKILILLVFVCFAIYYAVVAGFEPGHFAYSASTNTLSGFFAASVAIFFAYSGFQTINSFTAEVKGGPRTAAKGIIASVAISMVLYVLVAVGLLMLAPASNFKISGDPLAFALGYAAAPSWVIIVVGLGALVATTSAGIAMMMSASRSAYQISKDGLLPRFLRNFNRERDVPVNAVIISAIIAIAMLFAGNIYIVAAMANFGAIFSYLMTSVSLVHFRRTRKGSSFRSPFYPWIAVVTVIALLVLIAGMPQESLVVGVIIIIGLIMTYYILRELEHKRVIKVRLFS